MNKIRAFALVLAALTVTACASTNGPPKQVASSAPTIGGSYGVFRFEGLPAADGYEEVPGAKWTPREFKDLQILDQSCHAQMDPQIPGVIADIAVPSIKMGLVGGASTGLGAVAAFTGVSFGDYAKYGGISMLGSSIMSYSDRHALGKRYVQYACMQFATSEARRNGRLKGIGIIPNAFSSPMKGVSMPTGPSSRGDIDTNTNTNRQDEEESPIPPGGF